MKPHALPTFLQRLFLPLFFLLSFCAFLSNIFKLSLSFINLISLWFLLQYLNIAVYSERVYLFLIISSSLLGLPKRQLGQESLWEHLMLPHSHVQVNLYWSHRLILILYLEER